MQNQWTLQRQILTRYRSLGIVSQLPGFQGNVPWALAALKSDSNITQQGDTGGSGRGRGRADGSACRAGLVM